MSAISARAFSKKTAAFLTLKSWLCHWSFHIINKNMWIFTHYFTGQEVLMSLHLEFDIQKAIFIYLLGLHCAGRLHHRNISYL
jgi:hypothetical protein